MVVMNYGRCRGKVQLCTWRVMGVESLLSGDSVYPLLAAAVMGVLTLILIAWCVLRPGTKTESQDNEPVSKKNNETAGTGSSQSKAKKAKVKPISKKVSLPIHPLLAAEFKGHTDGVLSIDIDPNGKFLTSCSEGMGYEAMIVNMFFKRVRV